MQERNKLRILAIFFIFLFQMFFIFLQNLLFDFEMPVFEFFKLFLKIWIYFFEKFFCGLSCSDLLPFFKDTIIIVLDSIILLSHFHEFFFVIFQEIIILNELFINIKFMLDIFFFFFETVSLDKISLSFDSIILIIKFKILNLSSVDHAREFIFHFWIFVVGCDCMSNNRVLIFIQKTHDTHSFIFLLFLFPWIEYEKYINLISILRKWVCFNKF